VNEGAALLARAKDLDASLPRGLKIGQDRHGLVDIIEPNGELVAMVAKRGEGSAGAGAFLELRETLPMLITEAEKRRAIPEWRPIAVMPSALKRWGRWAVEAAPVPVLFSVQLPAYDIDDRVAIELVCARIGFANTPHLRCRPICPDGVPVPWSEVGL
jgi:hypothetical protein